MGDLSYIDLLITITIIVAMDIDIAFWWRLWGYMKIAPLVLVQWLTGTCTRRGIRTSGTRVSLVSCTMNNVRDIQSIARDHNSKLKCCAGTCLPLCITYHLSCIWGAYSWLNMTGLGRAFLLPFIWFTLVWNNVIIFGCKCRTVVSEYHVQSLLPACSRTPGAGSVFKS